jgi:tRNA (cmo5U34)-methyltransferase
MSTLLAPFSDPAAVARYAEGPPRFVPGFADLHRMTGILLAERAPANARILALGAGGGLELKAMAQMHSGWTFDGVDPAPEMLKLARHTLGVLAERARLHEGLIDDAPDGPFDAGMCLLTLHFLPAKERTRTLTEIRRRLKPGAPFVAAHSSFPQDDGERSLWLKRYAAFALGAGADPAQSEKMRAAVEAHLSLYEPDEDAAMLRDAGFKNVSLFYAAFTWRGWVAYA